MEKQESEVVMMKIVHTLFFVSVLLFSAFETGHCRLILSEKEEEEGLMINAKRSNLVGSVYDRYKGSKNDAAEIESIGLFAVQEHNKKKNSLLEFARVIKAKEQVVAGKIYDLTLEAIDAGKVNIYEAKVWVKPWMNFKQLQEFKHVGHVPSFSLSDDLNVN